MTREIDLCLLRAFVAVSETGGMTSAGRHLNLTQAAVSQQIKRLEELFGSVLFDRNKRGLSLTIDGERLVPHAKRLLALNDETWGLMTSRGFEGEVRIGAPHDLIDVFLPGILREFSKAWPRVEVSLVCSHTTELLRELDRGEIEVVLATEEKPTEDGSLLLSDRLVWVGAPGGTAYQRSPLPVTMGDEECTFRAAAMKRLSEIGRDWRFTCATNNQSAFRATLEADLAVAPLLSQTVPAGLAVLGAEHGLPDLPTFFLNLYSVPVNPSDISLQLAKHIEERFGARRSKAA